MALQESGPISINDIKTELGSNSNSLRSLSDEAGFTTPDYISEFYGYSSGPTPTYYVDATNGNDNNSGTSSSTAWKTISKVNQEIINGTFQPGDFIGFKRGERWTDEVLKIIALDGASGNEIRFGAYGNGANPLFDMWIDLPDWQNTSRWSISSTESCCGECGANGEVLYYNSPTMDETLKPKIQRLWLKDKTETSPSLKEYKQHWEGLTNSEANQEFQWSDRYRWAPGDSSCNPFFLKVWVGDTALYANITDRYSEIKYAGHYESIIKIENSSYIIIENIDCQGGSRRALWIENSNYNIVQYCSFRYFNQDGLNIVNGSYNKITHCTFSADYGLLYDGPLNYEIQDQHITDIQYDSNYNEISYCDLKGGGISHFRVYGSKKDENPGQPTGNKLYNCYIQSDNGWSKSVSINYGSESGISDNYSRIPKDTEIYNNLIECRGQAQVGGINTKFYFNIFKHIENIPGFKVLHHVGAGASEGYEEADNNLGFFFSMDGGGFSQVQNIWVFNNTFYKIGREGIKLTQTGFTPHILNNLFIDCYSQHDLIAGSRHYYLDLRIEYSDRGYIVKNSYSFNSRPQLSENFRPIYYGKGDNYPTYPDYYKYYTEIENINNSDDFAGNIYKTDTENGTDSDPASGQTDITSISQILMDPENNNFSIVSNSEAEDSGLDITSLVPADFKDRDGNLVDRLNPNIGAIDSIDDSSGGSGGTSTSGVVNQQWDYALTSTISYTNPYKDVDVTVTFTKDTMSFSTRGFWDGGDTFRIRTAFPSSGTWSWTTSCSDTSNSGLHNKSGTVEVSTYSGTNPLYTKGFLKIAADNKSIVFDNGERFLWLGDSAWGALVHGTYGDWKNYIDDRVSKNFTIIHVSPAKFWGHETDSTIPNDVLGNATFLAEDKWNPTYWQEVDKKIQYANDQGVVIFFSGISEPWYDDISETNAKLFAKNVTGRYFGNFVIWAPSFDNDYNTKDDNVANEIKNWTSRHLVSQHPGTIGTTYNTAADQWYSQTYLDFSMNQTGHNGGDRDKCFNHARTWNKQLYDKTPDKWVVNGEAYYDANGTMDASSKGAYHGTAYDARALGYLSFLYGATGYTYGAHGIWNWSQEVDGITVTWDTAVSFPSSTQMKYLYNLFNSINWWNLVPNEAAIINQPSGEQQKMGFAKAVDKAIAYIPQNVNSIELDMSVFTNNVNTFWYDPENGTYSDGPQNVSNSGTYVFNTPDSSDWVLKLEEIEKQ